MGGPEVFRGEPYGIPNDVFAMGIILFIVTLARLPFTAPDESCPLYTKIKEGDMDTYWAWQNQDDDLDVTDAFKQIIPKFFTEDPGHRITISQIKKEQWFCGDSFTDQELSSEVANLCTQL